MPAKKQSRPRRRPAREAARGGERASGTPAREPGLRQLQSEWMDEITQLGAACTELERELGQRQVPELETLIELYRLLILKFCLKAKAAPGLFQLLCTLMKPVLEWARLEEKRKERELAEQKYRDNVEAQKAARANSAGDRDALTAETLEKIQREVKLL